MFGRLTYSIRQGAQMGTVGVGEEQGVDGGDHLDRRVAVRRGQDWEVDWGQGVKEAFTRAG